VLDPVGRGFVTAHVEGIGTTAGPPARGTIFDVGSAEASEQKAAARIVVEVSNMVRDRVGSGDYSTTED
jgi:hypothetical protein